MSFSSGKNLQNNINTTENQTLSNKTLDNTNAVNGAPIQDSTITNASIESPSKLEMKQYADLATAQADLASRSGGELIYVSDIKKTFQVNDDLGTKTLAEISGGQGGVNYIENSDFEQGVDGYSASGVNFTIAQTKAVGEVLRGEASAKLSKTAVDAIGQEISVPFTVSRADLAKRLTISIEKDASDPAYVDDDIQIYVKQDPNGSSSVIRINGEDLKGGKGIHYAQFQTDASQTEYELVFKVNSGNLSAYDVIIDDVKVGPTNLAFGFASHDEKSYSPTYTNFTLGNGTEDVVYSRLGQYVYIRGTLTFGSTSSISGEFSFSTPDGISISSLSQRPNLGSATLLDAGTDVLNAFPSKLTDTSIKIRHWDGNNGDILLSATSPFTWTAGDIISWEVLAKVDGWSSNAAMSEDLGGREVVVEGKGNDGSVVTASVSNINFTEIRDTASSWDGYVFTAPETAEYSFDGSMRSTTSVASWNIFAYIDTGSGFAQDKFVGFNTGFNVVLFGGKIRLNKGDKLAFRSSDGFTLSNNTFQHHLTIEKSSSPQTILETETVAARCTNLSAQTITTTSWQKVTNWFVEEDTHNAFDDVTNDDYTVPVSGYYTIIGMLQWTGNGIGRRGLRIRKNNGDTGIGALQFAGGNTTINQSSSGLLYLEKGDVITFEAYQESGGDLDLAVNTDLINRFSIARIK